MNLLIKCLYGKKHLLQIEKEDLTWECVDATEKELGTETIYKASIIPRCFKCGADIKIDFYVYEYPEGRLNYSKLNHESCTLSYLDKNTEIETLFGDCYSKEKKL